MWGKSGVQMVTICTLFCGRFRSIRMPPKVRILDHIFAAFGPHLGAHLDAVGSTFLAVSGGGGGRGLGVSWAPFESSRITLILWQAESYFDEHAETVTVWNGWWPAEDVSFLVDTVRLRDVHVSSKSELSRGYAWRLAATKWTRFR